MLLVMLLRRYGNLYLDGGVNLPLRLANHHYPRQHCQRLPALQRSAALCLPAWQMHAQILQQQGQHWARLTGVELLLLLLLMMHHQQQQRMLQKMQHQQQATLWAYLNHLAGHHAVQKHPVLPLLLLYHHVVL